MPVLRITDAIIIPLDRIAGIYHTCYRIEHRFQNGVWLSDIEMKKIYGEKVGNHIEERWHKAIKRKKAGSSPSLEWFGLVHT
jgi:hypothetical protein